MSCCFSKRKRALRRAAVVCGRKWRGQKHKHRILDDNVSTAVENGVQSTRQSVVVDTAGSETVAQQFAHCCSHSIPMVIQNNMLSDDMSEIFSFPWDYLKHMCGNTEVEVSVATTKTFSGDVDQHTLSSMPLSNFLDYAQKQQQQQQQQPQKGAASCASKPMHLYLAQSPIWTEEEIYTPSRLAAILPFIPTPDILKQYQDSMYQINLWFSVGGTESTLHYDANQNLLHVITGSKRVRLYPPADGRLFRPNSIVGLSPNHSPMKMEELLLLTNHNGFEVEIYAGEMLFIPEGWWHQVTSAGPVTIAVNYWWRGIDLKILVQQCDSKLDLYIARRVLQRLTEEEKQRRVEPTSESLSVTNDLNDWMQKGDFESLFKLFLTGDDENILMLLKVLSWENIRSVLSFAIQSNPNHLASRLSSLSGRVVERLTRLFEEDLIHPPIYETLFSVLDDRAALVKSWLAKQKKFGEECFQTVIRSITTSD